MNLSKIVSWMGVAAAFLASAGCGSSNSSVGASGVGESCTRTGDCGRGLACIDQICLRPGSVAVGDAGADGSAGDGGLATRLGQACANPSDCGNNLTCVPSAAGGIQGGLCDLASYGIMPTGMTCTGECKQDLDCQKLPVGASAAIMAVTDAGTVAIHTCDDLLQYMLRGDTSTCQTVTPDSTAAEVCNLYANYCDPNNNPWMCDGNNMCQFNGSCDPTAPSKFYTGFCPTESRTGRLLGLSCTPSSGDPTTGSCTSTGCTQDSDCYGHPDVSNVGTCVGSDCICFQSACYFSCGSDLDCPNGYACDSSSNVCKLAGCTSSQACRISTGNAKAVCDMTKGACAIPCGNDHDCSPSSGAVKALGAFTGDVCGTDGFCTSVLDGCSTDDDCKGSGAAPVNTFCVTTAAAPTYQSAITN
jgi:hypothetical protein